MLSVSAFVFRVLDLGRAYARVSAGQCCRGRRGGGRRRRCQSILETIRRICVRANTVYEYQQRCRPQQNAGVLCGVRARHGLFHVTHARLQTGISVTTLTVNLIPRGVVPSSELTHLYHENETMRSDIPTNGTGSARRSTSRSGEAATCSLGGRSALRGPHSPATLTVSGRAEVPACERGKVVAVRQKFTTRTRVTLN